MNGITVSPVDGSTWFVSCSNHDPVQGGLYRLTQADFSAGSLPAPQVAGLGILDGIGVTRRGSVLASTPRSGELHLFTPEGEHRVLKLDGENICRMVADFNVCYPSVLESEPALLVPDISVGLPPGDATVSVIDLSGF